MKTAKKKNVGINITKTGISFRLWAPNADKVTLIGTFNNWSEDEMINEKDGYWHYFSKTALPGQEYKYVIYNKDQKLVHNDPRSIHFTTSQGSSVIASSNFDWDGDKYVAPPISEQVIYELHIGTFNREDPAINGNFSSVIDKLDYLSELGVTTIELMPISTMIMDRGWGYGIDYIFAVESLYGGHYSFKKFVKEAHSRGIGVVVDVVYNHFGPDSGLDLWRFDGWGNDDYGGIYFYNDWRAQTPWGNTRPDYGRPEVNQYILDNIRMLMHDCHVDGLRVDSTIYMRNVQGHDNDPSNDLPDGWEILQKINKVAKSINPNALMIGEDVGSNEYITKPISDNGTGFSSQWEVYLPSVFRDTLKTDKADQINLSGVLDMLGRRLNNDPFQRVIYLDSHDSAANGSSYFSETISPNNSDSLFARKQALIAATLLLTCPGLPMVFQGQEFLQSGSFSDWQGVDWKKSDKNKKIVDAYKKLIELRKNVLTNSKGLTGANCNVMHFDDTNKVIGYHRWSNGGQGDDVMVIVNFGNNSFVNYSFNVPNDGVWNVRFYSTDKKYINESKNELAESYIAEHGNLSLFLPASTAIVLSQ